VIQEAYMKGMSRHMVERRAVQLGITAFSIRSGHAGMAEVIVTVAGMVGYFRRRKCV
jgi:hypothetical protein